MSKHTPLIISACVFFTENNGIFENTLMTLSGPKGVWLIYLPSSLILDGLCLPCLASWEQAPTLLWFSAELVLRPSCTFEKLFFLGVFIATLFCFGACYPREGSVHEVQGKEKGAQNQ